MRVVRKNTDRITGEHLRMGVVYRLGFFRAINAAATVSGILFVIQAALFFQYGVMRRELAFGLRHDGASALGVLFVADALICIPTLDTSSATDSHRRRHSGSLPH